MDAEELEKFIKKYNVVKRTKACFMFVMENYVAEEPERFKEIFKTLDINSLEAKQSEIKLCYNDDENDDENKVVDKDENKEANKEVNKEASYVSSMLEIQFNGEVLGYYACIFGLDGALKLVM